MPDDDATHQLPASFGKFPLYNTAAFRKMLPNSNVANGGVFFPMWQREAMFLGFDHHGKDTKYAIRVSVGNINAISGRAINRRASEQDYVVVPGQPWLDGILVESGLVRQFVAMPRQYTLQLVFSACFASLTWLLVGKNYTVEGQLTKQEKFGGIQIEVIPSRSFSQKQFWYGMPGQTPCIPPSSPKMVNLKAGDCITMSDSEKTERPMQLGDSFRTLDLPREAEFQVYVCCPMYEFIVVA